ncbi:MAG TPA: hypothetical protein PLL10_11585, partial [Elusimicrobiales bacterium]|nr:hypothetical protein [Elusimicrobiales bacterium]
MSFERVKCLAVSAFLLLFCGMPALASEADLKIPDLSSVTFLGSINGHSLLVAGLFVCFLGIAFGWVQFRQIR